MEELLTQHLINLSKSLHDDEFLDTFSKNFVQGLNMKGFMQATYFLIRIIDNNYVTRLPWPVSNVTEKDKYIRELCAIIEDIKRQYPDAGFTTVQRSHFTSPRPENKRVIELMLRLSSLAINVHTGFACSFQDEETLQEEITKIDIQCKQVENDIRDLQVKIKTVEERNKECPALLETLKTQIVDAKVFNCIEEITVPALISLKRKKEEDLARIMTSVQKESFLQRPKVTKADSRS